MKDGRKHESRTKITIGKHPAAVVVGEAAGLLEAIGAGDGDGDNSDGEVGEADHFVGLMGLVFESWDDFESSQVFEYWVVGRRTGDWKR